MHLNCKEIKNFNVQEGKRFWSDVRCCRSVYLEGMWKKYGIGKILEYSETDHESNRRPTENIPET
jgi:hypothetical protein